MTLHELEIHEGHEIMGQKDSIHVHSAVTMSAQTWTYMHCTYSYAHTHMQFRTSSVRWTLGTHIRKLDDGEETICVAGRNRGLHAKCVVRACMFTPDIIGRRHAARIKSMGVFYLHSSLSGPLAMVSGWVMEFSGVRFLEREAGRSDFRLISYDSLGPP